MLSCFRAEGVGWVKEEGRGMFGWWRRGGEGRGIVLKGPVEGLVGACWKYSAGDRSHELGHQHKKHNLHVVFLVGEWREGGGG